MVVGTRRHWIQRAALILALVGFNCRCAPHEPYTPTYAPRSMILLIGDGLGEGQRQAARWFSQGMEGRLVMDELPMQGWSETSSANNPVTDSAAAATAMACGIKTNNGVLGMTPTLQAVANILEEAQGQGKSVGLITTTQLTNATPAGFVAHVPRRTMEAEIALQMVAAKADVLLGGGENQFLPKDQIGCYPAPGWRTDRRNLVEEARAAGYAVVCTPEAFALLDPATVPKLFGAFADEALSRPFAPSLAAMTEKALAILSRNPNGFLLMIEGGQIDWACHVHDAQALIADVLGLDETVSLAWNFAAQNQETLVIATADHETGGVAVSLEPTGTPDENGPWRMPDGTPFWVSWQTSGHTGANVPLNAGGPLCLELSGTFPNTHIFEVMHQAMQLNKSTWPGMDWGGIFLLRDRKSSATPQSAIPRR